MSRFWIRLLLFITIGVFNFCSVAYAEQKVAVGIFLADEVAYRTQHAFYMKHLFAKLAPEIEYRQIIVPTSLIGLNKEKTRLGVIEQLKTQIKPGDVIQYLILDTHGNTIVQNGQNVTTLAVLGKVGPDQVDEKFDQIFSEIKNKAAKNLTVILNSCDTFLGDVNESQKRAQTFLNYFNATDGRIYGAYVREVDNIYLDKSAFRLQNLIPSWKIYLTSMAIFAATMGIAPVFDGGFTAFEIVKSAFHGAVYLGAGFATLIETIFPIFSWLAGKTFANRGWFFAFKNGELENRTQVQKPRDFPVIIKSTRTCETLFN